jgi:hypothetical protein
MDSIVMLPPHRDGYTYRCALLRYYCIMSMLGVNAIPSLFTNSVVKYYSEIRMCGIRAAR